MATNSSGGYEIYDTIGVPVLLIDPDFNIITANERAAHAIGTSEKEIVGQKCYEKFHNSQTPPGNCPLKKMLETGKPESGEMVVEALAGHYIVTCAPVLDEAGNLDHVVHTLVDITKQKKASAKYQRLFESSNEAFQLLNEDMEFIEVNRNSTELYGYAREEMIGMTPADLSEETEKTKEALEELTSRGDIDRVRRRQVRKDGSTFISQIYANRFEIGDEINYLALVRDITDQVEAEEQLEQIKERLELAMRAANEGIWEWNLITDEVYFDDVALGMLGYTPDDRSDPLSKGSWWMEQVHPDDMKGMTDRFEQYVAGEAGSYSEEFRLKHKDGTYAWVSSTASIMTRDASGRPELVVGIHRDITERKRKDRALNESEKRFRYAMEATSDGLYDLDLRTNKIYYSPGYFTMLGYEPDDLPHAFDTYRKLLHPEDMERSEKELKAALARGHGESSSEMRFRTKTGEWKWLLSRAKIVEHDEKGRPARFVGTNVDITERKLAEQALRLEKERAQQYLDLTPTMFIAINNDGDVILANRAAADVLGYTQDEIIGRNWFDNFLPESVRDEVGTIFNDIISGKLEQHESFEQEVLTSNGKKRLIKWHNTTLRDENGVVTATLSSGQDVTEERRLREQLLQSQKMEAVGNLAGGIAHDFNNMLTVIMGSANLLQIRKDKSDPDYVDLTAIVDAAENAKDLTMKLLTFSRRDKLDIASLSVKDIIVRIVGMLERSIPKNIKIVLEMEENPVVRVDVNQIQHALLNICNNAVDSMPDGGSLTFQAATFNYDNETCHTCGKVFDGCYCRISIRDTGTGIPRDSLPRITEPFYTTKGVGKGTGLGLSVTHGIVESHNGHMHIYSEVNRGTCVKIYVPVDLKEDQAPDNSKEDEALTGSETVLVIDDEKPILSLAGRLLKSLGYTPLLAGSGPEGIELYRARKDDIDIVVLDLMMPDMDGSSTFRVLREINPEVKAVLSSGYSVSGQAGELLEAGVRGFVQKPFNIRNMFETIRKILDDNTG